MSKEHSTFMIRFITIAAALVLLGGGISACTSSTASSNAPELIDTPTAATTTGSDYQTEQLHAWTLFMVTDYYDIDFRTRVKVARVHDDSGNLVAVDYTYDEAGDPYYTSRYGRALVFLYSVDGYPSSMYFDRKVFTKETELIDIPITHTIDSTGRISSMTIDMPQAAMIHVEYSYYDDSDEIATVAYSFQLAIDYSDEGFEMLEMALTLSPTILPACSSLLSGYPGGSDAFFDSLVRKRAVGFVANFAEDGQFKELRIDGELETLYLNENPSRAERAGRVITNDDGTYSIAYDESGMRIYVEYDDGVALSSELNAFELIERPSRGAYIFGRLYE